MSRLSPKLARLAQVGFFLSMAILIIGTLKLLAHGGNPDGQVLDQHRPFAYAFGIALGLSVLLALGATILNVRARSK